MKSIWIKNHSIKNFFLLGIIFVFAFYPAYFDKVPLLSKYDILINLLIICGIFFYYLSYRRIPKSFLIVILYTIAQFGSTVWNHVDIKTSLWGKGILLIAMCGGIQWGYYYNEKLFLKTIYSVFYILLAVNLATLFLYPNGMYVNDMGLQEYNFFLGNYNVFVIYFFMSALSGYLYVKKYKGRITGDYIFLWLIILITFYKKRSATSMVGVLLLLIYGVLFNRKGTRLLFNIKTYSVFNLFFFFFIVWNSADNWIVKGITGLLNRNMTFSGRTVIWDKIKPLVKQKWLLGNGLETEEVILEKLKPVQAVHAHNLYLDILYKNGLIGFILIAILFFLLTVYKKKLKDQHVRYFLEAFLGIFMLMCQFEAYSIKFVFFMLIFLSMYAYENQEINTGQVLQNEDKAHII